MNKFCFIDLETTGTDIKECGIHQISGMIVIDGIVKEKFDLRVRPLPGKRIEEKALEVSHVTREQLDSFPTAQEVYVRLTNIFGKYVNKFNRQDKMFFCGYNVASFDMPFLRQWFEDLGDKYFGSWFWSVPLDVIVLAQSKLVNERPSMVDFKQGTVAKQLGIVIEEDKLHDALYDIEVCYEIWKRVSVPQLPEQQQSMSLID